MNEMDFKRWIRKSYSGWLAGVEPRKGGDVGIADIFVRVPAAGIIPVELKVGEIMNAVLKVRNIRPAQIEWHRKLRKHGGFSAFAVGVCDESKSKKKPSRIFLFDSVDVWPKLNVDFRITNRAWFLEIDPKNFTEHLNGFLSTGTQMIGLMRD